MDLNDVHRGLIQFDPSDIDVLVCDIDGTVADLSHRRHFVTTHPKNWAAFNERIHLDLPINHVIDVVNALHQQGTTVVMASGREGTPVMRKKTLDWLWSNGILHHDLFMRLEGDYREDDIVKKELLMKIRACYGNPDLSFDDRDRVVKMWRDNGIECIQVAEGDF